MTVLALSLLAPAHAASLDLLDVGGAYGTVAATNPSALWWNPAGIAVGGGTQFLVDVAPTFAGVDAMRTNPDYGTPTATFTGLGWPANPNYGGTDHLSFNGVVPFLGVTSDLTVKGLGVGLALAVPTARGGTSDMASNANRFALRAGSIQDIHVILGAAYQLKGLVALGVSGQYVDASYYADIDSTTYPDIAWAVADELGVFPVSFQDPYNEDAGYATDVIMGGDTSEGHGVLKDHTFTWSVGTHVTPLPKKRLLDISLAYVAGVKLNTEGDLTMKFSCPEDYDSIGQLAYNQAGLCDATFQGKGAIAYDLPGRIHLGVATSPIDALRLEAMGAYVMWSTFTDYDITTDIQPDQVQVTQTTDTNADGTPDAAQETADLVSQHRLWARDNKDTFWLGLDAKYQLHKFVTAGARVTYDHHAVPDEVVSANNLDNDTVELTGMAMFSPIGKLGLGVSFGHSFLATRTITNSAYAVSIAGADPSSPDFYGSNPSKDRYFYPSSNGTYSGSINRLGIVLKGSFGSEGANSVW